MASMGAPANMDYWLGRKYANLEKQTEGEYQRNTADAASIGPLREAQGFNLRATGTQALEGAATDAATRYMSPDWLRGAYRQLNEGALPPTIAAPSGGAGAPGAAVPSVAAPPTPTTPPPIQFQTLPPSAAPSAPAVPPATLGPRSDVAPLPAAPFQTGAVAPQLQSPEQLTQAALSRRRQVASLTRPGFRRGTARVKPQGLAKGTPDVKPDETFLGTSPGIIPGALPPGMMAVAPPAVVSAAPGATPSAAPGAMPGAAPGFVPAPTALPPPGAPPVGLPNNPTVPPMGPSSLPPAAGPAPSAAPNTWPGGQPKGVDYNPNAMTGVENLGGIVDFTSRVINPDKFAEAVKNFRLSENVEDRRGEVYDPNSLTSMASNIGQQILSGGQALAADIGSLISGGAGPAAPGSLAEQAGYNQIGPPATPMTIGTILNGFRNPFGSSSAAPAPAAPLPASSTVTAPAAPAPAPTRSPEATTESQGLKKGSANVKGKGKASKADSPPQGLEALLPLLMAMQGGGGGGPPAGPPPAPGFKKGSANVKSKGKASKGEGPSLGLEELLAALSAAGAGSAGPPVAGPPMPPGFAFGIENVQFTPPPVAPLMTFPQDNRYAQGTSSVPFGANYVSGAHEVPGQGTGKTDMIPAMLAPHEAVLNRAAADMLGRGLIAALNARGVKEMGMHRGAAT